VKNPFFTFENYTIITRLDSTPNLLIDRVRDLRIPEPYIPTAESRQIIFIKLEKPAGVECGEKKAGPP
jgi:hypothetical protein